MEPNLTALEFFLRHGAVLGLAFVFLAAVLCLILWVAIVVVGILRKWMPLWFEAQIKSHQRVGIGISRLSRFVVVIYRRHEATHNATLHLVLALDEWIKGVKLAEGAIIPSGVAYHVKEAKDILEKPFIDIFDPANASDDESQEDTEEAAYDKRNDR